jgi:Icc-related predicted phosphoesterase
MRMLILSDAHGDVSMIERLADEARKADCVVFAGDFAEVGQAEGGKPVLELLCSLNDRLFAVTGNCDLPTFRETLEDYDAGIEASLSYFSGLTFCGSGGGSIFTGVSPNERTDEALVSDLSLIDASLVEEATDVAADDADDTVDAFDGSDDDVEDNEDSDDVADSDDTDDADDTNEGEVADSVSDVGAKADNAWDNLVVVAHNPPKGTKLDQIVGGIHVGSPLIRAFIEDHEPLLVISGHIHESAAIDRLGRTTLVNPGSIKEGRYAVAEITGGRTAPLAVASIELKRL